MTALDLFADLEARGLIHDSTDRVEFSARLARGPIGVYVGFDPTAPSLHVGHLLGQITLRRMQMAGHKPYPLAGGATGMVGDPSGRSQERNLLDEDTLRANVESISGQLSAILEFGDGTSDAVLLNNADWTSTVPLLAFLRDIGKHFSINHMLAKESIKSRLTGDQGLSFTEFSYMLLQANDFRHLCANHGVEAQMGGSDQWGNITAGIDLIRRTLGRTAHGATWPLVTRSDGTKFGKTADGAVWLDPRLTSPYQFRQFWMNLSDDDVDSLLPRFSLSPMEEIDAVRDRHRARPETRTAQRALADEMTAMIHGAGPAAAAASAADVLFGTDPTTANRETLEVLEREIPSSSMSAAEVVDAFAVLARTGLVSSSSEARRAIAQRSVRCNGVVVDDAADLATAPRLAGHWLLLKKGKSNFHLVRVDG
jgi:tyrosyl-tRNA synthetase